MSDVTIDQKVSALIDACAALSEGHTEAAGAIISRRYPFVPIEKVARKYTIRQTLQLFVRDGFIDRYSGGRLVCPASLRLIHKRLPVQFPFHPHGRGDACHFAFWELLPTFDHIRPVSRGGADDQSNWATTSMIYNAAKANWTLEELRWKLHPSGSMKDWDGLLGWFVSQVAADRGILSDPYLRDWHTAARSV